MPPPAVATTDPRERTASSVDGRVRLAEMFEVHHNLVWRMLRRSGLDADAAADIGQQAFVVAIERLGDIWPGSERAFLVRTALRLAQRVRRKAARFVHEVDVERLSADGAHAESRASTLELLDRVLAQLDPTLVDVFVLFDVEGFSAPEIADTLEIPTGTVASRLRRAREQFRLVTRRLERVDKREEAER